ANPVPEALKPSLRPDRFNCASVSVLVQRVPLIIVTFEPFPLKAEPVPAISVKISVQCGASAKFAVSQEAVPETAPFWNTWTPPFRRRKKPNSVAPATGNAVPGARKEQAPHSV